MVILLMARNPSMLAWVFQVLIQDALASQHLPVPPGYRPQPEGVICTKGFLGTYILNSSEGEGIC